MKAKAKAKQSNAMGGELSQSNDAMEYDITGMALVSSSSPDPEGTLGRPTIRGSSRSLQRESEY